MKKILLTLSLLATFNCNASVNHDLKKFFDDLGFESNATAAGGYNGQNAGYYTGGSLYARNKVRNVQIAHIDMPSYRSGCGGIDLYLGGFSYINSERIVELYRQVLNHAKAYAFTLAMEVATPQLSNVMKYIQSVADKVNQANINSCETAVGLVGSVWPKTESSQRLICQQIASGRGGATSDWAAARQACGSEGLMSSTLKNVDSKYKELVNSEGNIAWKAIQRNTFLQSDHELAELFMTISGSIIIKNPGNNDDSPIQFKTLASRADDLNIIKALLYGGDATIYKCDNTEENGCLNPSEKTITISPNNSLQNKVLTLLNGMLDKIYLDEPLTNSEIGLVNASYLPVLKILNVQAAFGRNQSVVNVNNYADVIAADILFQYLEESLSIVKYSSTSLQFPQEIMQQFTTGLNQATYNVHKSQENTYKQVSLSNQIIQQTQLVEQMLAGQLSGQLSNNIHWAKGLEQLSI